METNYQAWQAAAKSIPKGSGNYTEWEKGQTKIRIMSAPIFGYEYWNTSKKPVRSRDGWTSTPADAQVDEKGQFRAKYFWAFVVWNYKLARLQVAELTQSTIIRPIEELVMNEDYGDPTGYDITVTRRGDGLETEYGVIPSPPKARPIEAVTAFNKAKINLEALFDGGDPFAPAVARVVSNGIDYPEYTEEVSADQF